jgi:hypothetical protein
MSMPSDSPTQSMPQPCLHAQCMRSACPSLVLVPGAPCTIHALAASPSSVPLSVCPGPRCRLILHTHGTACSCTPPVTCSAGRSHGELQADEHLLCIIARLGPSGMGSSCPGTVCRTVEYGLRVSFRWASCRKRIRNGAVVLPKRSSVCPHSTAHCRYPMLCVAQSTGKPVPANPPC